MIWGIKMEEYKKIIKEYREGSFEKRFDLYFKCRELRKEFNEIELEDITPVSKEAKDKKKKYMIFRPLKWDGTSFE
jgi:hypothetical protein